MGRTERRPATVTDEHREEAARLKAIWDAKKGKWSQEAFGQEYDIGTQGAVWRFLHGRDPISLKAASGFARGLGCSIGDFSPRLAATVSSAGVVAREPEPYYQKTSPEEEELLENIRHMDDADRDELLREAAKRSEKYRAIRARIMAELHGKVAHASKSTVARTFTTPSQRLHQQGLFDPEPAAEEPQRTEKP